MKTKKKTSTARKKVEKKLEKDIVADGDYEEYGCSRKKRKHLYALIVIVLVMAGLGYFFRAQFIVATVNGQPIWRWEVVADLEKQGGKRIVDTLVTKALVLQEAEKKGVTISDSQIDKEIKKVSDEIKKQGQELDKLLEAQGMTRDDLVEQIRMQKLVEKMAGEVKVSDKEVEDYMEETKESIPEDMETEEVEKNVRENLRQQKLNEKIQTWINSLKEKAEINELLKY